MRGQSLRSGTVQGLWATLASGHLAATQLFLLLCSPQALIECRGIGFATHP